MWTQAASKTNDTAGDGTTTATILSAAIIAEGMKIVAAGTNPIQVREHFSSSWGAPFCAGLLNTRNVELWF